LHHGNKSILVGKVKQAPSSSFVGKIIGFEPPSTTILGVNEGEEIEFKEENIISMGR